MKNNFLKVLALVTLLAIAFTLLPASALTSNAAGLPAIGQQMVGTSSVLGDVNNDGNVSASDALMILRYSLDIISLTGEQLAAADCNGDNTVNTSDALVLMRYCVGIPMPEPQVSGPTFIVDNASASAGETVTVTIRVKNNPGVAGAILKVSYDSKLTLTGSASGEAFSYLQFTRPGQYSNPCNFSWDSESGMATDDGVILTLTFEVSDSAVSGDSLNISLSYRNGDIYDEDLNDVYFDVINGNITVR